MFTSKVVVSKKVLERKIVITGHEQEVMYDLSKSSSCDDLGCMYRL